VRLIRSWSHRIPELPKTQKAHILLQTWAFLES
jgi:hypothetical protein